MARTQFAILGAGALGSIVGAHLARAGHAVTMLVRERRARQIEAEGLRISGLAEFSTRIATLTNPAELRAADVFLVATKAIDTAAALARFRGTEVGVAFSIQNGVMKDEVLASTFAGTQILGALANFSGEMLPSGEVIFTRNVNLTLGDLDGTRGDQAQAIARIIDESGVRSTAVNNIRGQEWSKFAAWIGLAALAVTTRASTWKFLADAGTALVLVRLVREVGMLAAACGVELTDDSMFPIATLCHCTEQQAVEIILGYGAEYRANSPAHRMSTLQDLEAHRPLELDETFGFAVRKAAEMKLKLPLLEAFCAVAGAADRTNR